jgi:hypothetical protein
LPSGSKRQSSILLAFAEKTAMFTPDPSQMAPSGNGRPAETRVLAAMVPPVGESGLHTLAERRTAGHRCAAATRALGASGGYDRADGFA